MKTFDGSNTAQHSVQPTWGTHRVFRRFSWLGVCSVSAASPRSHPKRLTPAVSQPDDGWSIDLESSKHQRSNQTVKVGCVILVAVPLLTIAVFIFQLVQNRYPPKDIILANQDDPADVALAFAYSLPWNEMAKMKSYIVQDKWEFIDKWLEIHEPISNECLYPWDADFQGTMMFGGADNGGLSSVSLFYAYDCPEYGYWFDLSQLELKLIDGTWQIISWEEICEERGSGRRCLDSDSFVWRSG